MLPEDQRASTADRQGPAAGAGATSVDYSARLSLTRPEDRRIMPAAFAVALVLHALCMLISFPESRMHAPPAERHGAIVIQRYVPPPPPAQRPRRSSRHSDAKRKIPVPDPTPDALEPIVEPRLELAPESLPAEGDLFIGSVEPPSRGGSGRGRGAGTGPALAGVGGVSNPVRIEESYVRPEYPEMARAARIEGQVILKAVICHDGSVILPEVLRCVPQGFGFAESAITAVEQWRYRPAMQDGEPVDCYFTIVVDFELV
jgi:protein TonB